MQKLKKTNMKENQPLKVTIGLPVFNGEKYIQKRIDSILNQTFSDFEVIISDNASTDKTQKICQDYTKNDSRIRYVRHEKSIGGWENFQFLINNVESKYFVWAAVDDYWLPEFLEKNLDVLESKKYVGSISKISYIDSKSKRPRKNRILKIRRYFSYDEYPKDGGYENRIEFYLRFITAENIYAVFRTIELRKSLISKQMQAQDLAIILNILKFGEIKVLDEVLMHRTAKGMMTGAASNIERFRYFNDYGLIGLIFPYLPFTFWFAKTCGMKLFFKNLGYLLFMNYAEEVYLIKYLARKIKNKF